jgi:hypothetical protein
MSEFTVLQNKMLSLYNQFPTDQLYRVDIEKNVLFDAYINALDSEDDKQSHRCNCCKNFLNHYGSIVHIDSLNHIKTLWDFEIDGIFSKVPAILHKLVKEAPIENVFYTNLTKLGTEFNHQMINGVSHKWNHFFVPLSKTSKSIEELLANCMHFA